MSLDNASELREFSTLDLAKYIGVDHKELFKKLVVLFEKDGMIEHREIKLIKPRNGERRRQAYWLSAKEFIYLVCRYHPKSFFGVSELLNKVLPENIDSVNPNDLLLRNLDVENFARVMTGLTPLDEDGKAISSTESVENSGLTDDQLRAIGLI